VKLEACEKWLAQRSCVSCDQACYNRALLAYGKALIFLVRSVAHSSLYMHFLNRSHVGTDVPTLASNFCYAVCGVL